VGIRVTFSYGQQSEKGEFIVSYAMSKNLCEVTALGKYHLQGSTREFEVSEEDFYDGKDNP
jgi:hypothetical protein